MRKIRNPDFFYTYQNLLRYIYEISPRTHRIVTANAAIFNTPGKDAELLSPLVWVFEENEAEITSDIKKIIEFDLIYSSLLTHALEDDELAKAIFNIASTLRTANALTMDNLHHIISFPSIDNPQYYPTNDDERRLENFNNFQFMIDLSHYLSTTAHSHLINCSPILSFVYRYDLINHRHFIQMITFIAENNASLNKINQLLEDTIGVSEEDCLKNLFKIDFINTKQLQLIEKILNLLKIYGELTSEKINFIFSNLSEKSTPDRAHEIYPFLENTLTNILNLTFFEMDADIRLQLISNLDALDDLFLMELTLTDILSLDFETRDMLLNTISNDNVGIITFFIHRQQISPSLFFCSYINKDILIQLSEITIKLSILGELNDKRLEQLFKNVFNEDSTPSDIKNFLHNRLSEQFDSIIEYDFFNLPDTIVLQLLFNSHSIELIWKTGISLTKFASLNEVSRENAIQNITPRNAIIVGFFSDQDVPAELFFKADTLFIIDEIALILMQDNAQGIASEQLEDLYFKCREYFLVLRRRLTEHSINDFFHMHLELLEKPEEMSPVVSLSENRAGFFSASRSSGQSNSDDDRPPSSPT